MKTKRSIILALAAVVLVLAVSLPTAWAYFTTYTEAKGGVPLQPWRVETKIKEEVTNWVKHVVIENSEDGGPVYVRARAYSGSIYPLTYTGEGWTDGGDGFWYYDGILNGGEATPELLVKIDGVPKDAVDGQEFNVVVVYETTPVQYDQDGKPYADWNLKPAGERSAES